MRGSFFYCIFSSAVTPEPRTLVALALKFFSPAPHNHIDYNQHQQGDHNSFEFFR